MTASADPVHPGLRHSPVHVIAGAGTLQQLGTVAAGLGGQRVLLVTDPGIERAGHVAIALAALSGAGLVVTLFDRVAENPTTAHVADGLAVARDAHVDLFVALGGGSAMDCAKGINLLLTNGGAVRDYWGEDKTTAPLLPLVAVPTTAGTGSEAQSFALISDAESHQKMACGDRRLPAEGGLRPRVAILDHLLTRTQPRAVAVAAGIDAVAHAVETAGTTRGHTVSHELSAAAWDLLDAGIETALDTPDDAEVRRKMLLGAHLAGAAIEQSMLGAAHALANPLTARHHIPHGIAVGLMLPHVVRFNTSNGSNPYGAIADDPARLADRIAALLGFAGVVPVLQAHGVREEQLPALAEMAATQWTARFNPVPVTAEVLLGIYRRAF